MAGRSPSAQRFPGLATVEQVVRATLRTPQRFAVTSPEQAFTSILDHAEHDNPVAAWAAYHHSRYGW